MSQANHTKSSGAMKAVGAIDIFSHSVEKHKLIYKDYIGDGDTSSVKEVVEAEPYKKYKIVPNKLECVGHVQKGLAIVFGLFGVLTRIRKLHFLVEENLQTKW